MAGLQWQNMEAIRLRGMSACDEEMGYTLAVMDAADLNKVLMIVKYDEGSLVEVVGVDGQRIFTVANIEGEMSTVHIGNNEIGKVTIFEVESTEQEALLLEVANMPPASNLVASLAETFLPNYVFNIKDSSENNTGKITSQICPSTVELQMNKSFSKQQKIVVLALAIKCSIGTYEIYRMFVPTLSKISVGSFQPDPRDYQKDSTDLGVASGVPFHNKMRVRAAGYSSVIHQIYLEIINPTSNKVILTAEFEPLLEKEVYVSRDGSKMPAYLEGAFIVRNANGIKAFTIYGILNDDLSYLYSGKDKLLGYIWDAKFINAEGKRLNLYCVESEREQSSRVTKKVRVIEIYDGSYVKQAEIFQDKCVVELVVFQKFNVMGMVFMLFRTLLASIQTFGLHRKPLPDIRYLYRELPGENRKAVV